MRRLIAIICDIRLHGKTDLSKQQLELLWSRQAAIFVKHKQSGTALLLPSLLLNAEGKLPHELLTPDQIHELVADVSSWFDDQNMSRTLDFFATSEDVLWYFLHEDQKALLEQLRLLPGWIERESSKEVLSFIGQRIPADLQNRLKTFMAERGRELIENELIDTVLCATGA